MHFVFNHGGVAVLYENPVGYFCCDSLYLPENRLISPLNFILIICIALQIRRTLHIQNGLKKHHPWVQVVTLHQIWANLELVAHIEDFADKMEHVESVSVLLVVDHIVHERSQDREAFLDDSMEWHSVFVHFELVSGSQGEETLKTRVN